MNVTQGLNRPRQSREVYTVSRLNREVHALLEGNFSLLWVGGEITNLSSPRSGHIYFTLKDSQTQVRCAMFRSRASRLSFTPEQGIEVVVRARVALYQPRGDFQLVIEQMEEVGSGDLQRAFEALKTRLQSEGLFDAEQKQAMPHRISALGIVTSAQGAALHDIISVVARRSPDIPIVVYPSTVQGDKAADEIVNAITTANQRAECNVLIVGRGGGSLEDLQPFNEERVARAIHSSGLPVISAVGHEIDFTISDFVADLRAPTPSAAAELLTPDRQNQQQALEKLTVRLTRATRQLLTGRQLRYQSCLDRLSDPRRALVRPFQRVDELEQRVSYFQKQHLLNLTARLERLSISLRSHSPHHSMLRFRERIASLNSRLALIMPLQLQQARGQLGALTANLDAVSPLATLSRGYAILSRRGGEVIDNSKHLSIGEEVHAHLAHGELLCRITEKIDEGS